MPWFSHNIFTRVFLFLVGVRVQLKGIERLDPNQTYVIVSNHSTSLDFVANAFASPFIYLYLVKKEILHIPLLGYIIGQFSITVNRKDAASRKKSMEDLKEVMKEGFSILIYPEGTRNRTAEKLSAFYDGAFKLAIETQTPLAIQVIKNPKKIAGLYELSPGKLEIEWLQPIPTKGMTLDDVETLKSKTWKLMSAFIED